MANRYLDESLETTESGALVTLGGEESRHAVQVARLRVGESIELGNGRGLVARGVVTVAEPSRLSVEIESVRTEDASTPRFTLVQALAKGDRDELAVQAATELGVDAIVPWASARSVSRWDAKKAEKGRARWASIAREAVKQSLRAWLPEVAPLATTKQLPAALAGTRVLVLEPSASVRFGDLDLDGRDVALVVGPEGGIAPEELRALEAAGAELVRLGDGVLRTSTAGPAAIAALQTALGRW
ncbi:16S rRNA (uracil(1498)-N(3))-methyltransferase [Agromyces seonyuensis]|uniref:Ribosomal RNA small subunit methyltransferase E n=1 Tax=Agromyces seonyuensis TaxID=2662446 RepID=A0A6I4NZP2_9MICO|nr:16S rRNA (uracil(1498)-N(3))-methyltransferase [Agromyces seonyuensis]MWB99793.1 16S rRNA (uracil(1498)-N(3))-methyltransferase [Agromyces seonyuensis]